MKHPYDLLVGALLGVLLAGCGVTRSEFDAVRSENERLRAELIDLRARNEALASVARSPRVELAGTEVRTLTSEYTGQTYQIKVKFPRGYDSESDAYPVLYVIDAETNFGGVSYIVQRLIKDQLIPKILIVGVAYGVDYDEFYRLRSRDLTPTQVDSVTGVVHRDPTGGAAKFADFFEHELFPFVEGNYRVEKDDRAIYGHSYGGLFGCYVFLNRSGLFNRYLLLSPSLWFNHDLLLKEVENASLDLEPTKLYLGSGRLEGRIDDLQIEFAAVLKRRNPRNLRMNSEVLENETHRTIFGAGFTNGLRLIFDARP